MLAALTLSGAAIGHPPEPDCSIRYSASEDLTQSVRRDGFRFDGFDRLCPILRRERLRVVVTSMNGVLLDRAYGWVSVVLEREASGVAETLTQQSTVMDRIADSPTAKRAELTALNNALRDLAADSDVHLRSVAAAEVRARALLVRPAQ
ncbi:hypothetical protein [Sphingomonas sp. SAFR-052]|uniref:hypothetical protein n=1 Tax=Sphingomonas sp. SAFR-052 TaxID=3436867 RepID=UPI003F7FCC26